MALTPKWHKRLTTITYILILLTIAAILYTLVAWWLAERSFEPLNVLAFAILSTLTVASGWLSRQENVAPPTSSAQAIAETPALGPLRWQMAAAFSLDELRTLCLDLGIHYDSLSGDTIETKAASLVAYMQRRNQLSQLMTILARERPHIPWPIPTQLQNRHALAQNVRAAWIDGVLRQSLSQAIALELKLTYQPDALTRKVIHVPGQGERPVEHSISDLFAIYGSLLILGDPGSGKTMTLLQLAETLLDTAEYDPTRPLPVVLNLSSWAAQRGLLANWLVEELLLNYQVPRETGWAWVNGGGLVYLLDGLDEVAASARDECVAAMNEFQAQRAAGIAVCSRVSDFETLQNRLNLGVAVRIQPLTDAQIDAYLAHPDLELTAAREMVKTDDVLKTLARTPLFLSVMTLAYRGFTQADLKTLVTPAARRYHLYQAYVTQMFARRPLNEIANYNPKQALSWLIHLAHGLQQHNQTVFYLERLQPTWLYTGRLYRLYVFFVGLIGGLIGGLIFGLSVGVVVEPVIGLAVGLIGGLIVGSIGGRQSAEEPIVLVEELRWVPVASRQLLQRTKGGTVFGMTYGLVLGLGLGIILGLISGLKVGLVVWLGVTVISALVSGVVTGFQAHIHSQETQQRLRPNQGIRNSRRNALGMGLIFGLVYGLSIGLVVGLVLGLLFGLTVGITIGLILGLCGGLSGGLMEYGGQTVVRHYTLRWLLARQGVLPFPFRDYQFVTYLDDMVDHILLRRVGGGWVFIHRTLLDYFAAQHPSAQPSTSSTDGNTLETDTAQG